MSLKNMALTAKEAKAEDCCAPCTGESEGPKYPYGLRVDLDNSSLDKLDMGLMPVGTEMMITAKARVVSVSSDEYEGSAPSQCMGLQIVALDLGLPQADRMAKSAKALYPTGDD